MKQHPAWIMWEGALTDEQCDEIIESGLTLEPEKASTFRSGKGEEDEVRKTQVRWMQPHAFPEVHDIIGSFAHEANKHFGLELTHLPYIQFTEYKDVGHFYGDHHDVDWDRADGFHRKISITVQLSDPEDYEGGEFKFMTTESPDPEAVKSRGTVIAFISYYDHAVTPITSGDRTSLVGWYEGPRWK
tara:strand:- start:26045 stop:26605 length:561 start_codon:yes stop_codon:yes gene_type:complete